jgi:hypothetical protein
VFRRRVFSASNPLQFRLKTVLALLLLLCFNSLSNLAENLEVRVVEFGSEVDRWRFMIMELIGGYGGLR